MKKQFLLVIIFAALCACQQHSKITLEGDVSGLLPGDTLILAEYKLPDWKELGVDTFYVTSPDRFTIEKELSHTTFFILNHFPKDRPVYVTSIRGATFVAAPHDQIQFTGSEDYWGALDKTGGFYDDPLIARREMLGNETNKRSINTYRMIHKYREEDIQDSVKKYVNEYNSIRTSQEQKDLRVYLRDSIDNNEFAAYLYLEGLYDVTGNQLEERLNRFNPEIRASYMGQQLEKMLTILKNIEPGNTPSEFTVTDNQGEKINFSDYRGKYTLIYNWGMCPGTIWVHPRILDLYERFHEKGFEIIGFTPDNFFELYASHKDSEEIGPLFNHPWKTVYTNEEGNEFIKDAYYFSGVPILMFISPEGVTLERGYTEVYGKMKNILEEKLGGQV